MFIQDPSRVLPGSLKNPLRIVGCIPSLLVVSSVVDLFMNLGNPLRILQDLEGIFKDFFLEGGGTYRSK